MSETIISEQTAPQAVVTRAPVRKERSGVVVSAKMQKTIVVKVTRRVPHPRYKKIVSLVKKFYAHDEQGAAKEGDRVVIREVRPLSRLKRWELVEVLKG